MSVIGQPDSGTKSPEWRDQIQHLLDQLDAEKRVPTSEGRRSARLPYRSLDVIVHVLNSRGEPIHQFQAPTRNLSHSGLAFLHKQMLAVGIRLRIEIPIIDERRITVLAEVTRCRHIKGMMHEAGVKFLQTEEPIPPN